MRARKLIHRATYAFVRDSAGYYYVQKRSSLKDYCPSFLDPTPGGVVAAGESYADSTCHNLSRHAHNSHLAPI